jgi:hypothetical protein
MLLAHLNSNDYVRFQAVIAVLLKIQVLDVTSCQFVNVRVNMVLYSEDLGFQRLCSKSVLQLVIVHFIRFVHLDKVSYELCWYDYVT